MWGKGRKVFAGGFPLFLTRGRGAEEEERGKGLE